ncbi:hypothetical protein OIU79_016679 [Salix purpurea]|uniref:Uncharacterized protein n=1 Tax=Salix purpurea TaxID=77065 RepID=A0A9Q0PEY2_SALPP|nr:hypothetical protein OIU79_016679 [Salix purpurea]
MFCYTPIKTACEITSRCCRSCIISNSWQVVDIILGYYHVKDTWVYNGWIKLFSPPRRAVFTRRPAVLASKMYNMNSARG